VSRAHLDHGVAGFHPRKMNENSKKPPPERSVHGKAEAARREQRLAAALRENLRKRKLQARAKDDKNRPDGG
jgi:hypothetical protein